MLQVKYMEHSVLLYYVSSFTLLIRERLTRIYNTIHYVINHIILIYLNNENEKS